MRKEKLQIHHDSKSFHDLNSLRRKTGFVYFFLRAMFRSIALTQHREIRAIGLENIPPDGAVFLVGNHPNSFLDFFNLLCVIRHPITAAAKDTITDIPVLGFILKKSSLLIPISRAQDRLGKGLSEDERRKRNELMVQESMKTIIAGRLFNIYAEGRTTDARHLNKIKLGFMHLALQAEKSCGFNLNLRIVPYGYYYDRINKFQSSVCIIFEKPFKIKNLAGGKTDYSSLSENEKIQFEKKILIAGKKHLQSEIEKVIISIHEKNLIELTDRSVQLYTRTPSKYMGEYENIFEKYNLSKLLSESIREANKYEEGKKTLQKLKKQIKEYEKKLHYSRMTDAQIRQRYNLSSIALHSRSLFGGILRFPLILFGYLVNFIPYQAGKFMRYYIIEVKKRSVVDGDEQAILSALTAALISYPLQAVATGFFLYKHGFYYISTILEDYSLSHASMFLTENRMAASFLATLFAAYLMARSWRFSLKHGGKLKQAIYFLLDALREPIRRNRLQRMRELRSSIIDEMDFLIGDYS